MNPKKKTTETIETESEEVPVGWYDQADPKGNYVPKLEGINYYEILSTGELKESTIKDRNVKSVEFEAIHHETTNFRNKVIDDSPKEPVEGILSVPLSAARKIRGFMEEKKIELKDIVGMILALQKTGADINTRYPSVELLTRKDYFE